MDSNHNSQDTKPPFEDVPVGIFLTDTQGNYTYVNQAWCDIAGITAEEASTDGWLASIHPDDRIHYLEARNNSIANNHSFACKHRLLHHDGQTVNVLSQAKNQTDEQGNFTGFIGSVTEITESCQIEQQLHLKKTAIDKERSLINAVFENSTMLILVMDNQGQIIHINQSCEKLTGYKAIEVLGKHPWNLFLPEDEVAAVSKVFRDLTIDPLPSHYENHWLTRSGEKRLISWHNSIIHSPDNQIDYIIASGIDITEKRATEKALEQHKDSLNKAQQIARMGSWDWDLTTEEIIWSDETFRILGATPRAFSPTHETFLAYVHPDDREYIIAAIDASIHDHAPYNIDHRIVRGNGEIRVVHEEGVVYYDEQGRPTQMIGTIHDITEQRAAEAERMKLSHALEQTADSVAITNNDGIIEYVNLAFCAETGYSRDEVIGNDFSLLKSGEHDDEIYQEMWQTILAGNNYRNIIVNRRKDGSTYYEEKTITPLKNEQGEITHFVSTGKDVTKSVETQERLHHMAHHDALTSLPNRLLFMDRLTHALNRAAREQTKLTILFLDLNKFKQINDTLGHAVGDKLLTLAARRLAGSVRAEDTVARLGGDEFAILLENTADIGAVDQLSDKIIATMAAPFQIDDHELLCSTSVGISIYPYDGNDPDTLLSHADNAMYQAKQGGRNKHFFFYPDDEQKRG